MMTTDNLDLFCLTEEKPQEDGSLMSPTDEDRPKVFDLVQNVSSNDGASISKSEVDDYVKNWLIANNLKV